MKPVFALLAAVVTFVAPACSGGSASPPGIRVAASVAPIVDIVRHVAGDAASVTALVPEGVDSHTFEPTPQTARALAESDLVIVNGLHLEDRTIDLARSTAGDVPIVSLGERAVTSSDYLYDFSFPRSGGRPNPHLWMDVPFAIEYARVTRDALVRADPAHAASYRANASAYFDTLGRLDDAIRRAVATIPVDDRVLLTYHDSFAYFARDYGFRVVGAIQPSDFAEPSAQEVARLIDQIEREDVPAIFGSEVFPSPVLAQIARETGVTYEDTLRDDDLPGDPGDPAHSYVGLMLYDTRTIVRDLGGNASALDGFEEAPS